MMTEHHFTSDIDCLFVIIDFSCIIFPYYEYVVDIVII